MKYKAFSPETEVTAEVLAVIRNADFPYSSPSIQELMQQAGFTDLSKEKWYKQQEFLDLIEAAEIHHGENAAELIGFKMLSGFYSMQVTDFETDLLFGDAGFQMCHRNGDIGFYELVDFDESNCRASMLVVAAYSPNFNIGLIKAIMHKNIPADKKYDVIMTHEALTEDGHVSYHYELTWEKY
jgi:hypothetical protein